MIINIPLSIDDAHLEGALQHEYEKEAIRLIEEKINEVLRKNHNSYGYRSADYEARQGLEIIIREVAADFMNEHRDEIISVAGDELAKKLARSKRGKELLEKGDIEL